MSSNGENHFSHSKEKKENYFSLVGHSTAMFKKCAVGPSHFDVISLFLILLSLRFLETENVSGTTQIKASVARGIRNAVLEQMPRTNSHPPTTSTALFSFILGLAPVIDEIMPKKAAVLITKWYGPAALTLELRQSSPTQALFKRVCVRVCACQSGTPQSCRCESNHPLLQRAGWAVLSNPSPPSQMYK